MEPVKWRKLQESNADMAKALGSFYKELKESGFSRAQAFSLIKIFMLEMMRQHKGSS